MRTRGRRIGLDDTTVLTRAHVDGFPPEIADLAGVALPLCGQIVFAGICSDPVNRTQVRGLGTFVAQKPRSLSREVVVAWLLRERATGWEWRVANSDLAWEAGGYDSTRFELHVLADDVNGTPDGVPEPGGVTRARQHAAAHRRS